MRKLFSALVLILGLAAAPVAAHATPVTYDLTLTSFSGFLGGNVAGGTGTLTVDSQPGSGFDIFTAPGFSGATITDLVLSIGGDTFTLADASTLTIATFFNGDLTSLVYNSLQKVNFHFESGLLYYNYRDGRKVSNGIMTATEQVVPTPEPSSILLFGTGAAAFGLIGMRKFAA